MMDFEMKLFSVIFVAVLLILLAYNRNIKEKHDIKTLFKWSFAISLIGVFSYTGYINNRTELISKEPFIS